MGVLVLNGLQQKSY